jgi:hypothetical protein
MKTIGIADHFSARAVLQQYLPVGTFVPLSAKSSGHRIRDMKSAPN